MTAEAHTSDEEVSSRLRALLGPPHSATLIVSLSTTVSTTPTLFVDMCNSPTACVGDSLFVSGSVAAG
jgi:hypothetical protein